MGGRMWGAGGGGGGSTPHTSIPFAMSPHFFFYFLNQDNDLYRFFFFALRKRDMGFAKRKG